jgi:hypothetical protein
MDYETKLKNIYIYIKISWNILWTGIIVVVVISMCLLNTQIIVTAMGNMDDVEYLLIMRDEEF